MTSVTARPTGRLHWRLPGASSEHVLDVTPSLLGRVRLIVDGRIVATVPKPSRSLTWVEREIEMDGREFIVVLSHDPPDLTTDVFMEGVSLIDGRTLAEAHRAAPRALKGFEAWTFSPVTGVAVSRIAPPWLIALLLVMFGLLTVGSLVRPADPWPTVFGRVFGIAYSLGVLRTWAILTARTHRWLRARSNLAEFTKLALFVGATVVIGLIVSIAAIGLLIFVAQLTGFVAG